MFRKLNSAEIKRNIISYSIHVESYKFQVLDNITAI